MAALTELEKDWPYTWQRWQNWKKTDLIHGSQDSTEKRLTLYMAAKTVLRKDWPYTWQHWQNWKKTDLIYASAENTEERLTSYMAAPTELKKYWPYTSQRWEQWRKTDIQGSTDITKIMTDPIHGSASNTEDWPKLWLYWRNTNPMRRDFDGAEKKADLIHASAENTAGRLTSYMLALRILQEDWPHTWQRWQCWRKPLRSRRCRAKWQNCYGHREEEVFPCAGQSAAVW